MSLSPILLLSWLSPGDGASVKLPFLPVTSGLNSLGPGLSEATAGILEEHPPGFPFASSSQEN